jgi:hypothetical protein
MAAKNQNGRDSTFIGSLPLYLRFDVFQATNRQLNKPP